jgi:hypothetical protein
MEGKTGEQRLGSVWNDRIKAFYKLRGTNDQENLDEYAENHQGYKTVLKEKRTHLGGEATISSPCLDLNIRNTMFSQ